LSYCPKCGHEYAETVERCIDCGRQLRRGGRPVRYTLELEDYLIPTGAIVCILFAMLMLYLRVGSQAGWITGPIAQLVQVTQPPCLTVFYAVAVVACSVVLAWWFIQILVRRQ
jgi:hypothetical protein